MCRAHPRFTWTSLKTVFTVLIRLSGEPPTISTLQKSLASPLPFWKQFDDVIVVLADKVKLAILFNHSLTSSYPTYCALHYTFLPYFPFCTHIPPLLSLLYLNLPYFHTYPSPPTVPYLPFFPLHTLLSLLYPTIPYSSLLSPSLLSLHVHNPTYMCLHWPYGNLFCTPLWPATLTSWVANHCRVQVIDIIKVYRFVSLTSP